MLSRSMKSKIVKQIVLHIILYMALWLFEIRRLTNISCGKMINASKILPRGRNDL